MPYVFEYPSDRGFFRPLGLPVITLTLIKANIIVFLISLLLRLFRLGVLVDICELSRAGFFSGMIWQPFTYMFLHANLFHIFMNMLLLFFMGPEVERALGARHYLIMYLTAGILGGLGWMLLAENPRIPCIGASGAIFGVLAAYATLFPRRRLTLLLFFIFPITLQAWQLVAGLAFIELLMITGGAATNIAYAAHLFGCLAGYLYVRALQNQPLLPFGPARAARSFRSFRDLPILGKFRSFLPTLGKFFAGLKYPWGKKKSAAPPQAEVDRILEKIARQGIQSLTRAERETLRRASANAF